LPIKSGSSEKSINKGDEKKKLPKAASGMKIEEIHKIPKEK